MAKVNPQKLAERKKLMAFSETASPTKPAKQSDPATPQEEAAQAKSGPQRQVTIRTNRAKEENYLVRREKEGLVQAEKDSARRSSEKRARGANTDLPLQMDSN